MNKKSLAAAVLTGLMALSLIGCGGGDKKTEQKKAEPAKDGKKIVLRVAYENNKTEPVGVAWEKAKEIIKKKSNGTMEIVTYPDSQLGNKSALIDSMLMGENVCTLADGAFYADYGVPDFGIVFGPFLFDNWDQCWKLTKSDWYKEQSGKLEKKGMKIRVPGNKIQTEGFNALGATATGMPLGEVYQALQSKTIEGAENPLGTLYGRKLQEVAKYLILDGHVKNFTTWIVSDQWFKKLTPEQQKWLLETAEEAGLENNKVQAASEKDYLEKLKKEGVQVVVPTPEVLKGFKEKSKSFYAKGKDFGWSDGLYEKVTKAMQ